MKKVSAAFDGLKFSESTLQYAISIAMQSKSVLTGVFLEDFTYHSYKLFDMVGSQGVSKEKVKELMDRDAAQRTKSADEFKYACIKNHVGHLIHHDRSIAAQELLRETIFSDLLLISANETFSHFPEERPTSFIKSFLGSIQCPVILLPEVYHEFNGATLLYDGTPSSVYAIKMFNYLMPWMKEMPAEVVTVQEPTLTDRLPDDELIKEFINCHYPDAKYTILHGVPEVVIPEYLQNSAQKTLAVLGAYQRSGVSRWFKPSMADGLMKSVSQPLFIAHNK